MRRKHDGKLSFDTTNAKIEQKVMKYRGVGKKGPPLPIRVTIFAHRRVKLVSHGGMEKHHH